MAKHSADKATDDAPDAPATEAVSAEALALRAEVEKLKAQLAVHAGTGTTQRVKAREAILAGLHHWCWQGNGPLFLGRGTGPNGECGVYRVGDIVPPDFALREIAEGGQSARFLVPFEGEAVPDDVTPERSPNANLPRPQAHDRAVTAPTGASA